MDNCNYLDVVNTLHTGASSEAIATRGPRNESVVC